MFRDGEKRYLTGEFAQKFDVKKDTLLYYDKIGLFRPAGVLENGYRYYTAAQGDAFWALLTLRQMDVPIEDLRGYFASPSAAALEQLASAQLAAVEREMVKLSRMRWLLAQMQCATQEGRSARIGVVTVCEQPVQQLCCSARNPTQGDTSAAAWSRQYDVFLGQLGLKGSAYIGSVIAQADVQTGQYARVDRMFVRDDAGLFGGKGGACGGAVQTGGHAQNKKTSPRVREGAIKVVKQPAGRYAVLYCKGGYEKVQAWYPFLLEEIARMGLRVCGDAYEEYLIYELTTGDEETYVTKISVAVEEA